MYIMAERVGGVFLKFCEFSENCYSELSSARIIKKNPARMPGLRSKEDYEIVIYPGSLFGLTFFFFFISWEMIIKGTFVKRCITDSDEKSSRNQLFVITMYTILTIGGL